MCNFSETVLTAQTRCPALDSRSLNLHCLPAVAANKVVVMMLRLAAAVENFTVGATENINLLVVGHGLQNPVSGSQRDLFTTVLEKTVKLLGAHEVVKGIQSAAHSNPLAGYPGLGSPPRRRWLR
ncbi:hypothetical protein GCM10009688_19220 [Arthrobacter gandavensis]|uniref:Uncharacterized protein n=1 Tax=Arthrobacter gandavensis TaxID=169960 RepID=A0ABP5AL02_9MICC